MWPGFQLLELAQPFLHLTTHKGTGSCVVSQLFQLLFTCVFSPVLLSNLPSSLSNLIIQPKSFSQIPDKSVSLLVSNFDLQVWGYLHLTSLTPPFKALQWTRLNRENIKVALQDVTEKKIKKLITSSSCSLHPCRNVSPSTWFQLN